MYPIQKQRPAGVSVLAILYFVDAVVFLLIGAFFAAIFGSIGLAGLAAICGGLFIVIGIVDVLIGWGLWAMQGWARTVAMVFAIIGLLGFPIGTIISIIILWYLFRPEIKAAFGHGPVPMYIAPPYAPPPYRPPPAAPPTAPMPPSAPTSAGGFCPNCGAPLQPGATFCPSCGAKIR